MTATLYCGDALTVLKTLPEESVQCVVTSPPYWGLRDYGTATWEGGEPACDHQPRASSRSTRPSGRLEGGKSTVDAGTVQRDCHCGAVRVDAQLGLEPTPEEYVAKLVALFGEVRRVLRADGTLWLNLGDSYGGERTTDRNDAIRQGKQTGGGFEAGPRTAIGRGLKPKDLVGIPWRVAFALQADGWWLRSDIIWAKPNPMPESVTDRPTKAHEYVFLLAKSPRYFYDADAIAEESVYGDHARNGTPDYEAKAPGQPQQSGITKRRRSVARGGFNGKTEALPGRNAFRAFTETRNARTVWEIATQPYAGAHFATFPEELARRCIAAGSRPGDVVLDPFGGSGTVAAVATGMGRQSIYIDLNPAYLDLAKQRIGPMLCEEVGGA